MSTGRTWRAAALGELPGLRVDGYCPDLAPIFRSARVAVAPLRYGSGLQNKVLESMGAGLPVVVTPLVNAPIGAEPGREILVARTTGEIAATIADTLADEATALRIGRAARDFVRARFSWEAAGRKLRDVLGREAGGSPSRHPL
jgi:glycosyltransferase involved in cell wall biosynthesis